MKGNIKTSHIPFLLLTGVTDKKSILEGMRLGAIDYIAKPFDKEVLRSKIANIFELRQAAPKAMSGRTEKQQCRGIVEQGGQ